MEKKLTKGLFITFEGPEGSGKSVHSRRIYGDLLSAGYDIAHTSEPGDTALGLLIRNILLEKDDVRMDGPAELFLFLADRAQHVSEFIRPALAGNKIVICDRFSTATFSYQGYGLGMDIERIRESNTTATGGLEPDLTILLDIDVETGLRRAAARSAADRMEQRDIRFHNRVREGYLEMARQDPERIRVISSVDDMEEVYKKVKKEIYDVVERYTGTE